jgi:hypothetical protein
MIHGMDSVMYLWVESYSIVFYILNQCQHKILKDETLEDMFTHENPWGSQFHVIGYPIYIHFSVEKLSNLIPKVSRGYFLDTMILSNAIESTF